jgi:CRISPR-associated protein Csh2
VQFSIGQSLNTDVEVIPISMTRIIPNTKNEQGESLGGTFGEKYVVRYSFIEFHGFVNNNVAKEEDVDLKEHDVITMLTAMWRGTDSLSTSSKFGQKSRLIMKVNYKNNGYLGDLDLKCKLRHKTEISKNKEEMQPFENILQVKLDLQDLLDMISKNKEIIDSLEYEYNPELLCVYRYPETQDGQANQNESDFDTIIKEWSRRSGISATRLNI